MRILIVEDEPVHARFLASLLQAQLGADIDSLQHQKTLVGAECYLSENAVDLVFLDLNLYGENGFELLGRVAAGSFATVVVSAHTDQAIHAFEYGVLDFLSKPVTADRLATALQRFTENRYASRQFLRYFSFNDHGSVQVVPLADISHFISAGKQLHIVKSNGLRASCTRKISEVERILPSHFVRVHKSYIVNENSIAHLRPFPGGKYRITLKDGTTLPVSRNAYGHLRNSLLSQGAKALSAD